jgi:hypothetical protein
VCSRTCPGVAPWARRMMSRAHRKPARRSWRCRPGRLTSDRRPCRRFRCRPYRRLRRCCRRLRCRCSPVPLPPVSPG